MPQFRDNKNFFRKNPNPYLTLIYVETGLPNMTLGSQIDIKNKKVRKKI